MKSMIIVALALVAIAAAAPAEKEVPQIIRSDFEQNPDGSFKTAYETENGIQAQETGEIKQVLDEDNKPHDVIVVRGYFSYIIPGTNEVVKVEYVADEEGFRAESDYIPKNPSRR